MNYGHEDQRQRIRRNRHAFALLQRAQSMIVVDDELAADPIADRVFQTVAYHKPGETLYRDAGVLRANRNVIDGLTMDLVALDEVHGFHVGSPSPGSTICMLRT